jgi:hypothetical protein
MVRSGGRTSLLTPVRSSSRDDCLCCEGKGVFVSVRRMEEELFLQGRKNRALTKDLYNSFFSCDMDFPFQLAMFVFLELLNPTILLFGTLIPQHPRSDH